MWKGNEMPISGYFGPIASYTDEEIGYTSLDFLQDKYFQMIEEVGLNVITYTVSDYNKSPEDVMKTLELCGKHNIGLFVNDSGLKSGMTVDEIRTRMKMYIHNPAFVGMYTIDEPSVDYFPKTFVGELLLTNNPLRKYQDIARKINSMDGMLSYINLLPIYAWMGNTIEDYKNYVEEYCDACQPKVLSYDHYPFDYENRNEALKMFFINLSIIREAASKRNIPYWAFVQCGGQWNDAKERFESKPYYPLEGEFFWNVNTCLAMGAKGIQYFPLIQPYWFALTPNGIDPKRNGLLGANGEPTQWYEYVKQANKQIQVVDEILMNSEHKGVIACGKASEHMGYVKCHIKDTDYRELAEVHGQEAGALIGCFTYKEKTVFYIVNYDMVSAQEIKLCFKEKCNLILMNHRETQTEFRQELKVTLDAGGAILVMVQ